MKIWARKPIEQLRAAAAFAGEGYDLRRVFGGFALTCFGVGSTIGAGVFVLTGTVAAQHTGPAVAIAYILASVVCLLAGLCYAELASMIPVAGSAYSYTYATLGEGIAWLVGWCLVLEYMMSVSIVAIAWSGYAQSALHNFGWTLPAQLSQPPFDVRGLHETFRTGAIVDLPAALVTLACTALLLAGARISAGINTAIVVLKVLAILVVVTIGLGAVQVANWVPFIPANTGEFGSFGWSGILRGTAILFFAYTGFDAVSTLGQETHRPQRTIPLALLASLGICTSLYVVVGLFVTGLVDYRQLNVPDPVYLAVARAGSSLTAAKVLVSIITVFGLVSVMIVNLLGQVRIFYAMGRDGLMPRAFSRVHAKTATPWLGTIVTGVVATVIAGVVPLGLLGELVSIGTLLAFAIVCCGVLVLRVRRPHEPRPFRVPFAPWTPLLGVVSCMGLMLSLPLATWVRLVVWLALGALVYFLYGIRHSELRNTRAADPVEIIEPV